MTEFMKEVSAELEEAARIDGAGEFRIFFSVVLPTVAPALGVIGVFGFTMIWSYASFCQFMLIWAGNLPEEITYYLKRKEAGWEYLTWSLVVVHWFIPFVLFLGRRPRAIAPSRSQGEL